jgi:hypothetical protein
MSKKSQFSANIHNKPNIIISMVLNKHANKSNTPIIQHKIMSALSKHKYIKYNNLTNSKDN